MAAGHAGCSLEKKWTKHWIYQRELAQSGKRTDIGIVGRQFTGIVRRLDLIQVEHNKKSTGETVPKSMVRGENRSQKFKIELSYLRGTVNNSLTVRMGICKDV